MIATALSSPTLDTGGALQLCKACGYQFTRTTPRGKPLTIKVNAVLWYLSGVSMSRIAFLSRVSVQAVLSWLRAFAKDAYEKPAPAANVIVLEPAELWHHMQKKRQKLWSWKALDRESGQLLAGNVVGVTRRR